MLPEDPTGHCTDCLDGYVEINGICEPTCDVLDCQARGRDCQPYIEDTDDQDGRAAFCIARQTCDSLAGQVPACDDNQAYNPMWRACQECGNIVCENDERHTGRIFPLVTNQFRCVCETRDGYYFDPSTMQTEQCDADNDGWVRRGAAQPINAKDTCPVLGDPECDCALKANAHCTINRIDTIVLHNVYGEGEEEIVSLDSSSSDLLTRRQQIPDGTLKLYETDANDDFSVRGSSEVPVLPPTTPAVFRVRTHIAGR